MHMTPEDGMWLPKWWRNLKRSHTHLFLGTGRTQKKKKKKKKSSLLAKEGASGEQSDISVNFKEIKSFIKALSLPHKPRDDYHLLNREQQSTLVRLRTGHNRLNAHMCRKLKLVPSPTCTCGLADQTAEHILESCPIYHQERRDVWPEDTTLQTKLYGSYHQLERTADFISRTGLTL